VGIEPSFEYRNQANSHSEVISSAFGDVLGVRSAQNYLANLRGTIGVPVDDFLFYATGGASLGEVKTTVGQLAIGTDERVFENTERQLGYSIGAGMKYRLSRYWSLGGEFTYIDLGSSELSADRLVMPGGLTYPVTNVKSRNTSQILQVNLAYHF